MKTRNPYRRRFAFFTLFSICCAGASAQWIPTGPIGGPISTIAVLPGQDAIPVVFVGTFGIYRSSDGGTSWSMADSNLRNTRVQALATMQGRNGYRGTILAAAQDGGYVSTDDGVSWNRVTFSPVSQSVHSYVFNTLCVNDM
jgi:hypothetical protein